MKKNSGRGLSDDSLHLYLSDIQKTNPCSRQSEQELFRRCRDGSNKARTAIISANMRFVLKVALQYRGCPIPLPDLISIGSLGLVKAIEKFDHTRGLKFISYAVWWIKAYITKALNEEGSMIRLPANQYTKIRQALKPDNNTPLNDEIKKLLSLSRKGRSLDDVLTEGSKATLADVIPDTRAEESDAAAETKCTEKLVKTLLADLPKRDATILKGLFGINFEKSLTLREIGEDLSISHERVRQLRDSALSKLKTGKYRSLIKENLSIH